MILNQADAIKFLTQLGFVLGTGFETPTYTNVDNTSMGLIQVWVQFTPIDGLRYFAFDATDGLNVPEFIKWWDKVSSERNQELSSDVQD